MIHVAVIAPKYLDAILEGRKRVEMRLSLRKQPWHGHVRAGERLYFKVRGGPIVATAIIARVHTYPINSTTDFKALRREFEPHVQAGAKFWRAKSRSRHCVAIWLNCPERVAYGPPICPGKDYNPRSAWCVLSDHLDVYPACLPERVASPLEGEFTDPIAELHATPPTLTTTSPQSSRTAPHPQAERTPSQRRSA